MLQDRLFFNPFSFKKKKDALKWLALNVKIVCFSNAFIQKCGWAVHSYTVVLWIFNKVEPNKMCSLPLLHPKPVCCRGKERMFRTSGHDSVG